MTAQPQDTATTSGRPRRILLKLSGEVFGGGAVGLAPDVVADAARQIARAVRQGVQVAVVVGGGNFFRGAELSERGLDRARADYMGMLGTVMNALALQDFIEKAGVPARVQSAIAMTQVAEPYVPAPGEGPRGHLRRRRGPALLLHRHGLGPAGAGDALRRAPRG